MIITKGSDSKEVAPVLIYSIFINSNDNSQSPAGNIQVNRSSSMLISKVDWPVASDITFSENDTVPSRTPDERRLADPALLIEI